MHVREGGAYLLLFKRTMRLGAHAPPRLGSGAAGAACVTLALNGKPWLVAHGYDPNTPSGGPHAQPARQPSATPPLASVQLVALVHLRAGDCISAVPYNGTHTMPVPPSVTDDLGLPRDTPHALLHSLTLLLADGEAHATLERQPPPAGAGVNSEARARWRAPPGCGGGGGGSAAGAGADGRWRVALEDDGCAVRVPRAGLHLLSARVTATTLGLCALEAQDEGGAVEVWASRPGAVEVWASRPRDTRPRAALVAAQPAHPGEADDGLADLQQPAVQERLRALPDGQYTVREQELSAQRAYQRARSRGEAESSDETRGARLAAEARRRALLSPNLCEPVCLCDVLELAAGESLELRTTGASRLELDALARAAAEGAAEGATRVPSTNALALLMLHGAHRAERFVALQGAWAWVRAEGLGLAPSPPLSPPLADPTPPAAAGPAGRPGRAPCLSLTMRTRGSFLLLCALHLELRDVEAGGTETDRWRNSTLALRVNGAELSLSLAPGTGTLLPHRFAEVVPLQEGDVLDVCALGFPPPAAAAAAAHADGDGGGASRGRQYAQRQSSALDSLPSGRAWRSSEWLSRVGTVEMAFARLTLLELLPPRRRTQPGAC